MFAARSFLDAGVKIAAHSDHPCAPYTPLMAIHGLVNRKTKAGRPIGSSQKVSVTEALRLYTVNSAYQQLDEDKLGSLEEGKLADMVVLGEDILTVPTERIKNITVDMTIIDGQVVFIREPGQDSGGLHQGARTRLINQSRGFLYEKNGRQRAPLHGRPRAQGIRCSCNKDRTQIRGTGQDGVLPGGRRTAKRHR
jgi:hypothetical protein